MLISNKQHWRSPAIIKWKSRAQQDYRTARKKTRGREKLKFIKSLWFKRIIFREQENVFFLNLDLSYRRSVLTCLFRHNWCKRSLPTLRKVIHIYSFLLQSKILLMYIMYYYMTNSYRPGIKKFDWFKAGL